MAAQPLITEVIIAAYLHLACVWS